MKPSLAVATCIRRYAQFQGRAGRKEFWYFLTVIVSLKLLLSAAAVLLKWVNFSLLLQLLPILILVSGAVIAVPLFAAGCRRLHDTGKGGWLQLLVLIPCVGIIIMIVLWAQQGSGVDNHYGVPPA